MTNKFVSRTYFSHSRRTIAKTEDLISATLNALYTKQGTEETKEITEVLRTIRLNLNAFN